MMRRLLSAALLASCALSGAPVVAQTTLNVRDADIRAFIADAAKVTGRTFIIDNRVQGKVTVVTDRPLSRSEYFEVFLSTLRANGLVAVPTANGALRVQPIDNAASQPGRIGLRGAARNQLVTEIIRLRSTDATQAVDTVRPLVSAQGSVTANRGGNSLVVVDFADNVRRVREVVRRFDTDVASTRIVALRNANAKEVATALTQLIGGGAGGGDLDPAADLVHGDERRVVWGGLRAVARPRACRTGGVERAIRGADARERARGAAPGVEKGRNRQHARARVVRSDATSGHAALAHALAAARLLPAQLVGMRSVAGIADRGDGRAKRGQGGLHVLVRRARGGDWSGRRRAILRRRSRATIGIRAHEPERPRVRLHHRDWRCVRD